MDLALPGHRHYYIGKMENQPKLLDLELWSNEELIRKQNRLKLTFLELFGDLGNRFQNEYLLDLHPLSKGKKVTQGNDLIGLPYQVLDLIRDFNFDSGLNVRILNWFGKGIYLFVLCGKTNLNFWDLKDFGFEICTTESPWDYSEIIVSKNNSQSLSLDYKQWFKELPIDPESNQSLILWEAEIKNVLNSLTAFLAKKEK